MNLSLGRSLIVGLVLVLLASLLPAAWWLDRTIRHELEARSREDLALAPMRLEDRNKTRSDALMMHAQEVARLAGLGRALVAGDRTGAEQLLRGGTPTGESPVLLSAAGVAWMGPGPDSAMWAAVREGHMPVDFLTDSTGALYVVSVAPVMDRGAFVGAAGVSAPLDQGAAATLAGLTASEVTLVGRDGRVIASTLDDTVASPLAAAAPPLGGAESVRDATVGGQRYWLIAAPLGRVAHAVFAVGAARELAVVPRLRRGLALAGGLGLLLALLLAGLMATALARPVGSLAEAADRMAQGDFDAPLPHTRLPEVARVSRAFERMRGALATRLAELQHANAELEQREQRLQALQSEMIQRDRLAAAGRLLAELAHEIRNPVANVRNCLEVIHRRAEGRPELRKFADLAIDELLRMHELAEQMLDLNRPIDPGAARCDPVDVVQRVAALVSAGEQGGRWPTTTRLRAVPAAGIAPDVLKQVLLSLVQNAREAMPEGGVVVISVAQADDAHVWVDVTDEGPGIDAAVLPRIFDPFFTTKGRAQGVGLGLFIAEGLVRRSGGRLAATNREEDRGARFTIELPVATRVSAPQGERGGRLERPVTGSTRDEAGEEDPA